MKCHFIRGAVAVDELDQNVGFALCAALLIGEALNAEGLFDLRKRHAVLDG